MFIWMADVCISSHTHHSSFCGDLCKLSADQCPNWTGSFSIFCYEKHSSTLRLRTWYCREMIRNILKVGYLLNGLWKCAYMQTETNTCTVKGGRITKGESLRVKAHTGSGALTCGWVGSLLQMSWTLRSCFSPGYNAYSAFSLWCVCRSIRSGSQALRECSFHPAALSCDWTHLCSYNLWIPTEFCCFYQG